MSPIIRTIRAIGSEFARRFYRSVFFITLGIILALIGLSAWLVTYSNWWWILLAAVIIISCMALIVLGAVYLIIRSSTPRQNPFQRNATHQFVDKIQLLSDTVNTPKIILLFRITKDLLAPRQDGFIGSISHATTSLRKDYAALIKLFDDTSS